MSRDIVVMETPHSEFKLWTLSNPIELAKPVKRKMTSEEREYYNTITGGRRR